MAQLVKCFTYEHENSCSKLWNTLKKTRYCGMIYNLSRGKLRQVDPWGLLLVSLPCLPLPVVGPQHNWKIVSNAVCQRFPGLSETPTPTSLVCVESEMLCLGARLCT